MSSHSQDIGTYVRLSKETRAELERRARQAQRSLSGEIRLAIDRHLACERDGQREAA